MEETMSAPLRESQGYVQLIDALGAAGAAVLVDGCVDTQKAHLMHAIVRDDALSGKARFRLIITSSDLRARELAQSCRLYDERTFLFPARDPIFYQADLRSNEIEREQIRGIARLMEGRPVTIVTTFAALMTPQVPLQVLCENVLHLSVRGEVDLDGVQRKLQQMGYEKNYQVERAGQFAVRGDILDVFDLTAENPCRIELWGDEVEAIRSFDVYSQRTVQAGLQELTIYPAAGLLLDHERLEQGLSRMQEECERTRETFRERGEMEAGNRLARAIREISEQARELSDFSHLEGYIHYFYPQAQSLLEFFDPEATLLFFDEPQHVRESADAVEQEFREGMASRAQKGYILPGQMALLHGREQIQAAAAGYRRVGLCELARGEGMFSPDLVVSIHARAIPSYRRDFPRLEEDLQKYRKQRNRVVIFSPSRTRAGRLARQLSDDGIPAFYNENPMRILKPGEILVRSGSLQRGFAYPQIGFVVIAESDIFGTEERRRRQKKQKKYSGESIADFSQLRVGDYVVHEQYGIGVYRGVEKITVEGIAKDYLKVEYAGGDVLYVLPTELRVLQKYASQSAAKPKINRLGGAEWKRTRGRVQRAVSEVAQDLVQLYAQRQEHHGYVFPQDDAIQQEFEEMFPYEETGDQLQAIEETKRDMESDKIMDRLICGDVGYGKTEIAIRAAFKCVLGGKQAAVLVPTTILAQQHFNTFSERMKDFPVNLGLLSRFNSSAQNKKVIAGLKNGTIDIVIGTHRLLSKDVGFKDLGLLVVDEEQRFGVTHKEKIKQLRKDVDVLTLSATPIPRTLHMSLAGIRDMSVLEEAPGERVPIQTYVLEYDPEMVREAIERELSRGGQIYYVYNRVSDIDAVAGEIAELVPEARVVFAHGQMRESELERIMAQFIRGEIDVLVSTTIIETGLDISNVNTIIIHDADRMGLSQLYQLRGRVGRSGRTAYAFLMYQRGRVLREVAEKRLAAIREYTDLGSGFKIAMRDLEIRGAGAVLGRAQSGHMTAVGYDLYCKMLGAAVRQAKGEEVKEEITARVDLEISAFVPESYIVNEEQKLEIYKKIAAIESVADYEDLRDELQDRFGEIPAPARNLLQAALLRSSAEKLGIGEITAAGREIRLYPSEKAFHLSLTHLQELLQHYHGALTFTAGRRPVFVWHFPKGTDAAGQIQLQCTQDILVQMSRILR